MNCRALSLTCRFLFHAIETLILTYYDSFVLVSSQGHFPRLENVGAFKNVSIVPTQATCGLPDRSTFCHSSVAVQSIISCTQRFCVQECPYRSSPSSFRSLLSEGLGSCITEDKRDLHPGSSSNASSFIFHNHKDCFSTSRPPRLGASFTLTVWLKPEQEGVMCVIEKAIDGQTVLKLTISEKETMFYYRTVNGLQPPIKVMTLGRILVKKWIHLTVQVHHSRISFFLNGWEDDSTPFDSRTLMGTVADTDADGTLQIGQSFTGLEQFVGRMQDFRFYPVALTNRDILEVFSGKFPHLHTQSECRCPGSHPRVHPLIQRYCIPNGADDTTNDRVLRLDAEAHPLYYINDNDIGTTWISSVFANTAGLDRGVSITIDLQNGQYQVFYIILQFFSPHPEGIKIERKKRDDLEWEDWQYFARNCSIFEMENNGSLEKPDSVNCLQLPSFTPYSRGNLTFSVLTPEPNHRPGYNDFYNTPSLQEFVKATQVRIHLRGQYHTNEPWVNFRHRYYGVNEVTVSGRCNCHGHADDCDTAMKPYKCLCVKESYTEGNNCDHCLPLYNDKPFRPGDQVHAHNCKPCQCYGHAESCHYDLAMDPFPQEHHRGGGGVCDNCQHSTAGRNCELCKDFHYRQAGADPSAIDVCKPCNCNATGTKNHSLLCDNIGGQCNCKRHVSGRQCNQCQEGFYNLQQSNPDGCSPCNCNTSGTVNGDITCHQNSGQCKCKANVIGLRCDSCNFGFKALRYSNEDGCEPCWCNSHGSVSQFCNPLSGQCNCKERVKGLLCDTCMDNFYGLDVTGCKACECDAVGSISGTVCDARTGQCACKPNIGGRRCDECLDGYHRVQKGHSFFCLPCNCEQAGTVNGSLLCDKSTGQCPCKAGVTGLRCSQCTLQTYNLSRSSARGCQPCDCDALGTLAGTACDHVSGQCVCLPQRQGRRCDECKPGFYFSPSSVTGCLPCLCHIAGSVNQICDKLTGQCSCQDASVTGQTCERCKELYFGFDSVTGRCQHCNCHPAGAISGTCHLVTGQCVCKQFVTGLKCDNCVPDASNLDAHNLFGCSKIFVSVLAPFQQPPPTGEVLNSSVINLSWSSPDSPNSNRLIYQLYRDEEEIYTTEDYHPYSVQTFTDTMLAPYTFYSYYIQASNVHGFTRSDSVTYRTKSGTPIGSLDLNPVFPVSHHSVLLYWTSISNDSGPIEKYILTCSRLADLQPCGQYEGLKTSAIIWSLIPFTKYVFSVQACTSGGCLKSQPVTVVTAQAPPEGLHPPTVETISSTELAVEWSPPEKPNGIIIRYELYMRKKLKSTGNFLPPEIRVFQSSGWLSPQPIVESQNENALAPPQTSTTVVDLEPFTEYEFYVLAVNMAGSISSDWISGRTGEAAPAFMPSPSVFPLSPHSLNVSWEKPEDNVSRGEVMGYSISLMTEQRSLPPFSQVLHIAEAHELSYVATGLKPYRTYNFTVTLCNQIGCVTSEPGMGQTLAAAPRKLSAPRVEGINSTTVKIIWNEPEELNGPSPIYQVERMDSSLATMNIEVTKGIRFPGNGYYKFASSTLPTNTYFTGIKVKFRTQEPDGLIFFSASPGNQEEYIALQLRSGRPYFLFDPQGSAVAVTPTNDGGKVYNDNSWHQVIATRIQALGNITVDGQYTGSSLATSGSTIIGENMGVFIGGLPQGMKKIVQKGFVGCLSDIFLKKVHTPYENWESLNWENAEEQDNVYHVWEGCPIGLSKGAHFLGRGFLELQSGVFIGGLEFEISFKFRTDQLNGLLLFVYNKDGPDYLAIELKSGILNIFLRTGAIFTQVDLWLGLSYCDGKWNEVTVNKEGSVISATMNELREQVLEPRVQQLKVNSPVYVGGIPPGIQSFYRELGLEQGFGGCMKDVKFTRGAVVNLASVSSSAVRVNLDGCLSTDSAVNCRGNDSILVYRGKERMYFKNLLLPLSFSISFEEYLYRVVALIPQNVPTPSRVHSINGYSIEVTWDKPAGVIGVIEKYILKAYEVDGPTVPITSAELADAGVLRGLHPFTNYVVTLTACTLAGCTESLHALNISTPQEAPEDVQSPTAISFPTFLLMSWSPPKTPNGIITQYTLYMNGTPIYSGNGTKYVVKDLAVFTPHHFLLTACTLAGCTNSSQVTLWKEPVEVNGILERYIIYMATNEQNFTKWNVIYNSTELFLDFTILQLFPGIIISYGLYMDGVLLQNSSQLSCYAYGLAPWSLHSFRVQACTAKGCALGPLVEARTMEAAPEGVVDVLTTVDGSKEVQLKWLAPNKPNGKLTYTVLVTGLFYADQDNANYSIVNDTRMLCSSKEFNVWVPIKGLIPFSNYTVQVNASNSQGSLISDAITIVMPPGAPDGVMPPRLSSATPTSLQHRVGDLQPYTEYEMRVVASNGYGNAYSNWTSMTTAEDKPGPLDPPLLLDVEGCTSKGCSLSPTTPEIQTLPDAPEDIPAPELYSDTPTSVVISWQPPARPNGLVENLTIERRVKGTEQISTVVHLPLSESTSYIDQSTALSPWQKFEYRVLMSTLHGGTNSSAWAEVTTRPSRPAGVQPPDAEALGPYSVKVSWKPPLIPNGEILNYEIRMPDPRIVIAGNPSSKGLSHLVTNLVPYTNYSVTVIACTGGDGFLGGCTESLPTRVTTPSTVPQSVSPLYELLRRKIQQPLASNPPEDLNLWHNIYSGTQWFYEDKGLSRYTTYEYKLVVHNEVGYTSSEEVIASTLAGLPEKGSVLVARAVNHTAVEVEWSKPTLQDLQGDVVYYTLFLNSTDERRSLRIQADVNSVVIDDLQPNTEYEIFSQSLRACSLQRLSSSTVQLYVSSGHRLQTRMIEACTVYACVRSNGTQITTVEDEPKQLSAPIIHIIGSRYVVMGFCTTINLASSAVRTSTFHLFLIHQGFAVVGRYMLCNQNISAVVGMPYSTSGNQICCGGSLHDSFNQQCCGGRVISMDSVCCGDEKEGTAYRPLTGMFCCGQEYVNKSDTICCSGSSGESLAHVRKNDQVPVKCCETELIPKSEECCNGVGYNPLKYVCSDKISAGMTMKVKEECKANVLCPLSMEKTAHCGKCDFDPKKNICAWIKGSQGATETEVEAGVCPAEEETVYTGGPTQYSFTDVNLEPFVTYEYRVAAWNSYGRGFSEISRAVTKQDVPQGDPSANKRENILSAIGVIIHYIILRNGIEHFRGTGTSFTDTSGVQPYQEYSYQLRACTVAGCTDSSKVVAVTVQGVPESVQPPEVSALNSTALHLSWAAPRKPNGIIREYQISQMERGLIFIDTAGRMQHTVSGVWPKPHHIIVSSTEVEMYWSEPKEPNGLITHYRLFRDGEQIFLGGSTDLNFTDVNLQPNSRYVYQLEASTWGGSNTSDKYVIQTPVGTPEKIHVPYNVTVIDAYSIFLAWDGYSLRPVGSQEELLLFIWTEGALEFIDGSDALQPFTLYEYRVRAQNSMGSVDSLWASAQTLEASPWGMGAPWAQATGAYSVRLNWTQPESPNGGTKHQAHLFGLKPFTTYHIHVIAVNNAGQVSSPWTSVRTLEASPSGLSNFTVEKKENGRALLLKWSEPSQPNGVIKYSGLSRQFLFRRLEPYTLYTLMLEACNAAGCTHSPPQPVWTDEAPPVSQMAPVIQAVNATNVELSWLQPINPNGKIIRYEVIHRHTEETVAGHGAATEDEKIVFTEYNTESNTFTYNDKSLQPWTRYEYKIRTWNAAGYTDSSWTVAKTSQTAPKSLAVPRLSVVSANPHKVLISWTPPAQPNGILQSYRLLKNDVLYPFSFDAATLSYVDEDLLPYTVYSYAVVACTMGGCSTSEPAAIRTLEAAPALVDPPSLQAVSATQVSASWAPPQIQNGDIIKYILKLGNEEYYPGKSLQMLVSNLQPYTQYDFALVACTAGGCTSSTSQSVMTMEAPPLNMEPPRLLVMGSESIEITWKLPDNPNGKITSYDLRRDGMLVYSGLETRYLDFTLMPGMEYSYTVTANNSQGSVTSPSARIKTNPSAPSGMLPPRLQAWSSSEILVAWDPPIKVNGDIRNYTVSIHKPGETEKKTFDFDESHVSFLRRYEVQLRACTELGCASSEWAAGRTLEAPPAAQPAPLIDIRTAGGFQPTASVLWAGPKQPNGRILYYELYRRRATQAHVNLDLSLVYNGSSTSFKDDKLLPYTEYEYQLSEGTTTQQTIHGLKPFTTM
ncbi:hypothetical protein IHE44_0008996 [Lamprotornis superbus]|uniref:Usherin n=1 Tax=Lamprotornis superbus TaxID=245042 RepID=A0A835NX07_9PASS|nr:hypothetical protein IHE44_0008996 [Lamprotornis superbus]